MAWTQALLQLQDLDRTLADNQRRLREIETQLQNNVELLEAERRVEHCTQAARAARKVQQDLEFELGQVQIKRDLTEKNLYGGRIHNSRELQDLQAELQSIKRRAGDLENHVLEAMMTREEADEVAASAEAQLKAARERLGQAQAALIMERDKLQSQNDAMKAKQEQLRSTVPPEVMGSYDYLKDRTANIPVARLRGDVCSVCGTEVLRPTAQKVRHGQVAYCDTCLRLLVE